MALTPYQRKIFYSYVPVSIEQQFLEMTFNISKDVDLLYNMAYKKWVKDFNKGKYYYPDPIIVDSSILKSSFCRKANKMGRFRIELAVKDVQSYIAVNSKLIVISPKIKYLRDAISGREVTRIHRQEISEERIKGIIAHELSHWIRDTLYNNPIKKFYNLRNSLTDKEREKILQKHVDVEFFEIDAQIHAIKQLKRVYRKEWDSLTLTNLFEMYNPLINITIALDNLSDSRNDIFGIWFRFFLKRMGREKLIGKNMRVFDKDYIIGFKNIIF